MNILLLITSLAGSFVLSPKVRLIPVELMAGWTALDWDGLGPNLIRMVYAQVA